MRKTILITGASGFTGVHACAHFRQRGMRVIAGVRKPRKPGRTELTADTGQSTDTDLSAVPELSAYSELSADEIRRCDVTDREGLHELVHEVRPDYVLHLAGMNDVKKSWHAPIDCLNVNVAGTWNLLGAVGSLERKASVLIVGSSLRFDPAENPPQPAHPYALSKTAQALFARSWSHLFSFPVMVAEPSNLIGPGTSAGLCGLLAGYIARWEQGLQDQPFQLSSLTEKRDFLDVRDAVKAYEHILLHGEQGELYRFGSGRLRSIGDVIQSFTAALGRPFPCFVADDPPRDKDPHVFSLESMARIGWQPRIPFEQSIRDILMDARNHLAN